MIAAVVVTYHPQADALQALLSQLATQAQAVIVVDNGSPALPMDPIIARHPQVTWVRNDHNAGLGVALNQGIARAEAMGATAVVFFDQDSEPETGMIANLDRAYRELAREHLVGAVGPAFVDSRSGKMQPFVRIGFPLNRKIVPAEATPVECDYLITSGCYVPVNVLREVGGLDASLFIDNLDMDWSFRARAKGYKLFGVPQARMLHAIGDTLLQLPLGMGDVMVHSPKRLYFSSRNRVLLYRRPHVSRTWVAQDIPRFALKFVRLTALVKPRRHVARAMLLGLMDGIAGRSGEPTHRFD